MSVYILIHIPSMKLASRIIASILRRNPYEHYVIHDFSTHLSPNSCSLFFGSMHIYVDNVNNSVYNLHDRLLRG